MQISQQFAPSLVSVCGWSFVSAVCCVEHLDSNHVAGFALSFGFAWLELH